MSNLSLKQRGNRYCKLCKTKLQNNGFNKTKKGLKRKWRCPSCNTSRQQFRVDLSQKYSIAGFVKYLIGTQSVSELKVPSATWRRQTKWCWDINPKPIVTGEIYDYLVIDVKHVAGQACAIIRNKYIRYWEYGVRENSELWIQALSSLPRPHAVVCDGQTGISKAIHHLWPGVVIQRCLVHVVRNIVTKLTSNPQTPAGLDLLWIIDQVWTVNSSEQMAEFIAVFNYVYDLHQGFIKQRTYNTNTHQPTKWWYTHGRVRGAYRQINKLIADDQLFAYITHPELQLPKTTNSLEGGINSRISELLLRHRGMTKEHQMQVVNWFLDSKTECRYLERNSTRNEQ
jgi:Transposase, Mutator family